MSAYEEHSGIRISCGCSDEVKNISPVDAVRARLSGGCPECGEAHRITVKFDKGGKK